MIFYILAGIGLLLLLIIVIMPAFRIAPFAYGASRLRAARAQFISKKELRNLAYLGYEDTLVAIDEKKHLSLANLSQEQFPEEKVQRRIREYRLQNLHRIIQYTPNKYRPFFKTLLDKETLEFIMGAIRSKLNPVFKQEVLKSMFTDRNFSVEQFAAFTMDELLTELEKTSYGDIISSYRADIQEGNLEIFEHALNVRYYQKLNANANHEILKKCVRRIIDLHVVKGALCFENYEPLKGNSFSDEVCEQLKRATTLEQVKRALESTYFQEYVKDVSSVREAYQKLYQSFDTYARGLAMQQPLSLNQMVAYYVSNIIEIKNLRILLKLAHAKFAPERIEEALI